MKNLSINCSRCGEGLVDCYSDGDLFVCGECYPSKKEDDTYNSAIEKIIKMATARMGAYEASEQFLKRKVIQCFRDDIARLLR